MNWYARSAAAGIFAFLTGTATAFAGDIYQTIYQNVDQANLQKLLGDMTGRNPVTVDGETFSINDRYLPASKANYRKYWTAFYKSLGMEVKAMNFKTSSNLETQGHNLEAILPGTSADSIIIIVHYDSMGPHGSDNPAVDDDMTGMAIQMETARLLTQYQGKLRYTVRFVAADYEEWGGLEGARDYAKYIKALAKQQGFKVVAGIDDEQSGWKEGADEFDIFDCGGGVDSTSLGNLLADTAMKYSGFKSNKGCMGENSDHYALWEIGVPSVVYSEHHPFNNPHFDHAGGDTYARIAQDYFFKIARVGVTFSARVVGVNVISEDQDQDQEEHDIFDDEYEY